MQDPNFIPSESSDGPNANPLQYPNVVSDLNKRHENQHQAAMMEAHSPKTAQILKAQQQIRNGEDYDSTVIHNGQKKVNQSETHVLNKAPQDETSEHPTPEQRMQTQQRSSVNQSAQNMNLAEMQMAGKHQQTQSVHMNKTTTDKEMGDPTLQRFINNGVESDYQGARRSSQERQRFDVQSQSSDPSGAALQYPNVVSDLNRKHDIQQVKNKMGMHSPKTAQILQAQQEIMHGKNYEAKAVQNAQKKADNKTQKLPQAQASEYVQQNQSKPQQPIENESFQPSVSSYDPNGAPLQYPNVVSDLNKRHQNQHQAAMMEVHSPKTAQILKAQQQIRNGEDYNQAVIDIGQQKAVSFQPHVLNKASQDQISEHPSEHNMNIEEMQMTDINFQAKNARMNKTTDKGMGDPTLQRFVNNGAESDYQDARRSGQERQKFDIPSQSSGPSGAALQYPNVVSDLNRKHDILQVQNKKGMHSPKTAQILQAQQEIMHGKDYEAKAIQNAKKKAEKHAQNVPQVQASEYVSQNQQKSQQQKDTESQFYSQSSYDPNGAPLQYPNVVSDLNKRHQDQHQAAMMEAHSPKTAQILKAQQQIRNGQDYDSTVIDNGQKQVNQFETHVIDKMPQTQGSPASNEMHKIDGHMQHSVAKSINMEQTNDQGLIDPTLQRFVNKSAETDYDNNFRDVRKTSQQQMGLDVQSQSSDPSGAALQYPNVVSDLNRKHDIQQVKNKMGMHSPKTAQILQAQQEIMHGKDYEAKAIQNAQKKAEKQAQRQPKDNESNQPSQSSEDPNGAALQYPRVVSDLDKRHQDQHQAALMESHTPKTTQILKAQQQIWKGQDYDSYVIDKTQNKPEKQGHRVVNHKLPQAKASESGSSKHRQPKHQSDNDSIVIRANSSTQNMNITEMQMVATQAQSLVGTLQYSDQPAKTRQNNLSAIQTLKRDSSRDEEIGGKTQYVDSTMNGSIQMGTETVNDSKQFRDKIRQTSQEKQTIDMNRQVSIEDETLTDRALKPKYSHRKNTQHLLKAAQRGGGFMGAPGGRAVQTQMQSVDNSARQLGLLTDSQFDPQIYAAGLRDAKNNKQTQPVSSVRGIGFKQTTVIGTKKNSMDQIKLRNILNTGGHHNKSSAEAEADEQNSLFHQQPSTAKLENITSTSVPRRTLPNNHHEDESLFQKTGQKQQQVRRQQEKGSGNSSNVKLQELSRSSLHKSNMIQDSLIGQQKHLLPTLARNSMQNATRNSSTVEKIGALNMEAHVIKNRKQRASVSQLKSSNMMHSDSLLSNGLNPQSTAISPEYHGHDLSLPDVAVSLGQKSRKNSIQNGGAKQEMLINDYNLQVDSKNKHGFNKISFKSNTESQRILPRDPKLQMKKQMKETQGSAIRIVKRQQNKFSLDDSGYNDSQRFESPQADSTVKLLNNNASVYHTQHHHTRKEMPQSAIMQQLLGSSKSSLTKIQKGLLTQQSTERFLHGGNSIGLGEQSQSLFSKEKQLKSDYNMHASLKRMKAAQKVIEEAEMEVTNAQNHKCLTSKECDGLLKSYLGSLENTIVHTNPKTIGLPQEIQTFVQESLQGIAKSAKLRQKLLDEQTELFDKFKEEYRNKWEIQQSKIFSMKEELESRPFQKHFQDEAEMAQEIEELKELAQEKQTKDHNVEASNYSGAQNELEQLNRVFAVIDSMKVGQMHCSYVDEELLASNETTVQEIGDQIKSEGKDAIVATAKGVLNKFWRHFKTQDGSTQTEEKVIDALKRQIFDMQDIVREKKKELQDAELAKEEVEFLLEKEKGLHTITRNLVARRDVAIEDLEGVKKQKEEQLEELKKNQQGLIDKFKVFADEIAQLKLDSHTQREQARGHFAIVQGKDAQIQKLESELKEAQQQEQEKPQIEVAAAAVSDNDEGASKLNQSSNAASKESLKVKKSPAPSKGKGKGKKKSSSLERPAAIKQAPGASPRGNKAAKLSPDAEKKMREEITEEITEQIQRKAKSKAKEQAKLQVEKVEIKMQAQVNTKQTRIDELEESLQKRENQLSQLQSQIDNQKMLKSEMTIRDRTALSTDRDFNSTKPKQSQNDVGGGAVIENNMASTTQGKLSQDKKSIIESNARISIVQNAGNSQTQMQHRSSVDGASAMESSAFSMKPMQPKLDNITHHDDQNLQKTVLVRDGTETPDYVADKFNTLVRASATAEKSKESSIKQQNTSGSIVLQDDDKKDDEDSNDYGNAVNSRLKQQNIASKTGHEQSKQLIDDDDLKLKTEQSQRSKTIEQTSSIPVSLQNKQVPTHSDRKSENSANSPLKSKRFDSADLVDIKNLKPVEDYSKAAPSSRNTNQNKNASGPVADNHSRKVSQGSQVEKSQLQASTIYEDDDVQGKSEGVSSLNMQQQYSGKITVNQISPTIKEQIQLQGQSTGDNYYNKMMTDQNYGNVMTFQDDEIDSTNQFNQAKSLDEDSDQTLYQKNYADEFNNKTNSAAGLVKKLRNPTLQKLERPVVDHPHNLYIESSQFQLRQKYDSRGHATFGNNNNQQPSTAGNQSNSYIPTNRILNQEVINEGTKMLVEGLAVPQFTGDGRAEKYQLLIEKAYQPNAMSAKVLLDQAKESMDGTELKLLMLMLQMRGQFDRSGGTMVSKSSQTEGILITNGSKSTLKSQQMLLNKASTNDISHQSAAQIVVGRAGQVNNTILPPASTHTIIEEETFRATTPMTDQIGMPQMQPSLFSDTVYTQHQQNSQRMLNASQSDEQLKATLNQQMVPQQQKQSPNANHMQALQQKSMTNEMSLGQIRVAPKLQQLQQMQQNPAQNNLDLRPQAAVSQLVDQGVQAGDDLIKLTMDRLKLIEKNKHMFFGSGGHQGTADNYSKVDGNFSPAPKHAKNPIATKAAMLNDFGQNDKVMVPSLRQQKQSAKDQARQKQAREEAAMANTQTLALLQREESERALSFAQQSAGMSHGEKFTAIQVNLDETIDKSVSQNNDDRSKNETTMLQLSQQQTAVIENDSTMEIMDIEK